jgi:hypothetical protein
MVAKSGPGWVLAPALVVLVDQLDAYDPGRSRAYDGSIGDAAHAARASDHNPAPGPDGRIYVTALDVTNAPWLDAWVADQVVQDHRLKYVIRNGRYRQRVRWSPSDPVDVWVPYYGPSPHDHHAHISVRMSTVNDTRPWAMPRSLEEDDTMTPEDRADLIRDIVDAVWAEPLQGELGAPERAGQILVRARMYGATARDLLPGISTRAVSTLAALAELLGRPAVDVDEHALAAELAPLLPSTVGTLSDDTLSAIARAVADEQGHRLGRAEPEPAPVDPAPAESGA